MKSGFVSINDLHIYYEDSDPDGTFDGVPLLVLHGAFCTTTLLHPITTLLSPSRRVLALEYQSHGHTSDTSRPYCYRHLAEDISGFLSVLSIPRVDILGYSTGGAIAAHFTTHHAEKVRKLVILSAAFSVGAMRPGMESALRDIKYDILRGSELESSYLQCSNYKGEKNTVEGFKKLIDKIVGLNTNPEEITEEMVRAWPESVESFFIVGDQDVVTVEAARKYVSWRDGGEVGMEEMGGRRQRGWLAVLPGTSHMGVAKRGRWIADMMGEFLEREVGGEEKEGGAK